MAYFKLTRAFGVTDVMVLPLNKPTYAGKIRGHDIVVEVLGPDQIAVAGVMQSKDRGTALLRDGRSRTAIVYLPQTVAHQLLADQAGYQQGIISPGAFQDALAGLFRFAECLVGDRKEGLSDTLWDFGSMGWYKRYWYKSPVEGRPSGPER